MVTVVKSRRWMKSNGIVQCVKTFPVFLGKGLQSLLRADVSLLAMRSPLGKTQG